MKKTYKAPLLTVNDIESELFLCASPTMSTSLNGDTEINQSSQVLSKENGFDLWGEDEE